MRSRTDDEIKAKLAELWPDADGGGRDGVAGPSAFKVMRVGHRIGMEVSSSYEPPGLKLTHLNELATFFGVENIATDNDIRRPGCETCDFGSRYGFTLWAADDF